MIEIAILAQETAKRSMAEVLIMGGGVIGYILWGISVLTVALIIKFFLEIRRETILPTLVRAQFEGMFEDRKYREVVELSANDPSYFGYIVHSALSEAAHGYPAMERAMEEAAEERTTKLLRSIEWLNLIGNIGPMLGLMGTVWGMINAFFKIVEVGSVKPEDLAGSIGIALVTTLLGLIVAVPALAVYAVMRNRIDELSSESLLVSKTLMLAFRPTAKKT